MNGWDKFFGDKKRLIAKQSAQIPCCEKARHTSILLRICKKIQGFEKPWIVSTLLFSATRCAFCVDTSLALGMTKIYQNDKNLSFWASETSEKSKEFKTHFKFKAKNPRLKGANLRFKFMDTSANASVWQGKIVLYEIKQVSFISMTRTKQQTFKARLKQTPRYLKSKFSQNNKLFK